MAQCNNEKVTSAIGSIVRNPGEIDEQFLNAIIKTLGNPEVVDKASAAKRAFLAMTSKIDRTALGAIMTDADTDLTVPSPKRVGTLAKLGIETHEDLHKLLTNVEVLSKDETGKGEVKKHHGTISAAATAPIEVLSRVAAVKSEPLILDGKLAGIRAHKLQREASMENIKASTQEYWGMFLDTYFSGALSTGEKFRAWVDNKIMGAIVQFDTGKGFTGDVNAKINQIKEEAINYIKHNPLQGEDGELLTEARKSDVGLQSYFNAILAEDFDFVLGIVSGMVRAETDDANVLEQNYEIEGLHFQDSDGADKKRYIRKGLPQVVMLEIGVLENETDTLILDDHEATGTESLVGTSSNPRSFHIAENGNLIYTTEAGIQHNVSPKVYYELNTAAKKVNKDSMDPVLNALDHDTQFIKNIFKAFHLVDVNGNNIRRMDYFDYQRLASHLVGEGFTTASTVAALKKVVAQNGPVAKIARGILKYVYEGEGESVTALASSEGIINTNIVQAVTAALTNKMQVRYVSIDEGKTKVTQKVQNRDFGYMIEDELSRSLLDGIYVKESIANGIQVVKTPNKPDEVFIDILGVDTPVSEISSMSEVTKIAKAFNLGTLAIKLRDHAGNEKETQEEAEKTVIDIFKNIAYVAAANVPGNNAYNPNVTQNYENRLFANVSPILLLDNFKDDLLSVLGTDVTDGEQVAGARMPANKPMDRNASIQRQIDTIRRYNISNNRIQTRFNPFIKQGRVAGLEGATYKGFAIKSPTMKDGKPIKLSSWSVGVRTKFSIVQGMFKMMPKGDIGRSMFLQPIAYSDKSQIPMHEIQLGFNAFEAGADTHGKVFNSWVAYNLQKNIDLQKITIEKMYRFLGSNATSLAETLISTPGGGKKVAALYQLINEMKTTLDAKVDTPNMTKPLNLLMAKVGLTEEMLQYNGADLDSKVDYVEIGGEMVMKPHLGEMAEQFATNPKDLASKLIKNTEAEYKLMGMDTNAIYKEAVKLMKPRKAGNDKGKDGKGSWKPVSKKDLFERIFFINGTYGHAIKTMTMGDESYFDTRYDDKSVEAYYTDAASNPEKALEDTYDMMIKQSKRAQSNLTNGHVYAHKETLVGLKRDSAHDNLIHYLEIYNNSEMVFEGLEGKNLMELEALGVIERHADGTLISADGTVRINIENKTFEVSSKIPGTPLEIAHHELVEPITKLIADAVLNTNEERYQHIAKIRSEKNIITRGSNTRSGGKRWIKVSNIRDRINNLNKDNVLTVADFTASILASDPVSSVDLLNSLGMNQENSDAIQLMHPLYELLFKAARGGELSGFHSEQSNALKTLTTTFEYGSYRQSLQKKSVQNPFGMEQLMKLGSKEVFGLLKKMNTELRFTTTSMTLPMVNEEGYPIIKNGQVQMNSAPTVIENLEDLFNHFKGYERGNDTAWNDVAAALQKQGENMHRFVGLVTVPSNQKTGQRKFNKWSDAFSDKKVPFNIDYMANEFNVEVLTKQHEYDTSSNSSHQSKLTLLSQLVNAVGFGGLTNIETQTLQNALEALSEVESINLGNILADSLLEVDIKADEGDISAVEARLRNGDIIGEGLSDSQKVILEKAVQSGMYDLAVEAFDSESETELINNILKDTDASADTPLVRQKLLNQMRSGFYKDVVQAKMAGFIGTVSTIHNVMNIYTIEENGRRVGRQAYIAHYLKEDLEPLTADNVVTTINGITPVDDIIVDGVTMKAAAVMYGKPNLHEALVELVNGGAAVQIVSIPTVSSVLTEDIYASMKQTEKVEINIPGIKGTFPKWYVEEEIAKINAKGEVEINIADLIAYDNIKKYTQDAFNLRWYQVTHGTETIEETDQYKAAYRDAIAAAKNKYSKKDTKMFQAEQQKKEELAAALILETRRVDENGKKYWKMVAPEVVLPTFNASAYGIKQGIALHTIIGTDGNAVINATEFFYNQKDKRFKLEETSGREKVNVEALIDKYAKKKFLKMKYADTTELAMLNEILEMLQGYIGTDGLVAHSNINTIILGHKKQAAKQKAKSFINSLDVTLTRIPGQTKQSGFAATVIEFLDSQGNATFAPTEHLVQTGGDFDIDTLSVLTKTSAANGIIHSFDEFKTDGILDVAKLVKAFKVRLGGIVETARKTREDYNERLETKRKTLEGRITKGEAMLAEAKKQSPLPEKSIALFENGLKKLKAEFISLKDKELTAEHEKDIVKGARRLLRKEFTNVLSNAMEAGVRGSLISMDTAVETQTPVSFDVFASITQALDEVDEVGALDEFKDSKFKVNGLSFVSHFVIENSAAQGKESIGIFATVLKMNSAIQSSYYSFNSADIKVVDPYVWHFKADYYSQFKGEDVTIHRTGYADVESFKLAEKISSDPKLQNMMREALDNKNVTSEADRDAFIEMIKNEVIDTMYTLRNGVKVDSALDESGETIIEDGVEKKGTEASKLIENSLSEIIADKIESLTGINVAEELTERIFSNTGTELASSFELC